MSVSKSIIREILLEWQNSPLPKIIPRQKELPMSQREIISIIGARRSGKTSIMFHEIEKLIKIGVRKTQIVFFSFEDERLDKFEIADFDLILQAQRELYPDEELASTYFFFDEIQSVNDWEKFVRRVHDKVSQKIYISGSNSKLLSSEIATSLRGRTLKFEVSPLNFVEFLNFNNLSLNYDLAANKAKIINAFNSFLQIGGFPSVVLNSSPYQQKTILQEYFNVMIQKDIAERYQVTNMINLKYFCRQLINYHGYPFTINKILNVAKSSQIKTTHEQLSQYLEYTTNVYMVNILPKFSDSPRKREQSEKKLYLLDNGMYNALSSKTSQNLGILLETAVYNHLISIWGKVGISFFKESGENECDFVVQDNSVVVQAVQVCMHLDDENTKKREFRGLIETCKALSLETGLIITLDTEAEEIVDGIHIKIIPAWKYLITEII
jgi:uncharacterized protein